MELQKPKSAHKQITVKSPKLKKLILETMRTISDIVGSTLGPGGQPVIIEKQDMNMPPTVTKDGVTVFKSLGFKNAEAHAIMEVARDSASRTATEAGDGTTTSTVISEALVRGLYEYCENNPQVSPQKVVRRLEQLFKTIIEPTIKGLATKVTLNNDKDKELLKCVARVSANGDDDLAKAIMECYDITGDGGNVALVEGVGASRYEVEKIDGYPIESGWDNSCLRFFDKFINDPGSGATIMENPVFLLYHGKLTEIQTISGFMRHIGEQWQEDPERYDSSKGEYTDKANIVIVACGYSESFVGNLASNFGLKDTINIFPLLAPLSAQPNGQLMLLHDLSAIASAKIFDPLSNPIERGNLVDVGPGVTSFQCGRTKSVVIGHTDTSLLETRIEEVELMVKSPESVLDEILLKERAAKLSGGIAKLRIWGSSNSEIKEKKDRAEDGVCAVKGALRHGVLPGGAFALLRLGTALDDLNDPIATMLATALNEPVLKLQANSGLTEDEGNDIITELMASTSPDYVYDYQEHKYVSAFTAGILDSVPAVLEAIRSSISTSSQLGTCGGLVVYARDLDMDRKEAIDAANWERDAGINEADLRA